MKKLFGFLILIIITVSVHAQLRIPTFFNDNMVLQQDKQVWIWGWDKPNQILNVFTSWNLTVEAKADSSGFWKTKIKTPKADHKKHTLIIKGSEQKSFNNVVLGEVWFASGQSNMTMKMKGGYGQPILGGNEDILHSSNNNIRMWTSKLTHSDEPEIDIDGSWEVANPNTTPEFSAVGYYFAREIEAVLDVPVGIILSGWGGSRIEAWMDQETLDKYDEFSYKELKGDKPTWTPKVLYNAMIHPFIGYTVKGFLWYQGEANRSNPNEYVELLPAMVNSWREQWGQGDLPFYYVQIAPYNYGDCNSAFQREAQQKCFTKMVNTGMVVTMDVGECNIIHPKRKEVVGKRLSYWAFANDYGLGSIACESPVYSSMQKESDGKIVVSFDRCPQGMSTFDKDLNGFQIAGEDQKFYSANAKIKGRSSNVIVWSDSVKEPVAVRYLFENCVEATLFSQEGIPVSSFRTDDWSE